MTSSSSTPLFSVPPTPADTGETLRQIERNTTELVKWMRYLVYGVAALVLLTVLVVLVG